MAVKNKMPGFHRKQKMCKRIVIGKTNKLARVGEWNSGLRICDFKHKLHTVFLGKSPFWEKMLILPEGMFSI